MSPGMTYTMGACPRLIRHRRILHSRALCYVIPPGRVPACYVIPVVCCVSFLFCCFKVSTSSTSAIAAWVLSTELDAASRAKVAAWKLTRSNVQKIVDLGFFNNDIGFYLHGA